MIPTVLKSWLYVAFSFFLFSPSFSQSKDSIQILIDKNSKSDLEAEEYLAVIDYFSNTREYSNGLVYSEKLIDFCKKNKDSLNLARAINRKAENLIDLRKIVEGIEFCETESKNFRKQDSIQLELLCFKWGMFYYFNEEEGKALDIYKKIKSKKYSESSLFRTNFSIIHAELKHYDTATIYLKMVLNNKNLNNYNLFISYSNLGFYALRQRKFEEALTYFDSAKIYADPKSYRSLKNLFSNYYYAYKYSGLLDDAFQTLDSINKYNELLFKQQLDEEILELKNTAEREQHLKKRVKVVDGKIEQYERRLLIWIPLILLVAALVSFWFFYRNMKAKKDLIILEQKLLRSQMTPHFIFNSLSVVQGMILNNENDKGVKYLSKFSKLLRTILENSRDKLVALEDEITAIINYLDLQTLQMDNKLNYDIGIDKNLNVEKVLIPTMLIQPFVENSIEHGFRERNDNPIISLYLKVKKDSLVIEISDNGIGINQVNKIKNPNKKSLSSTISAERLQILSKEYKTKSNIEIVDRSDLGEKGTKVILTIPYITM